MLMTLTRYAIVCLFLIGTPGAVVLAGVVFEVENTDHSGGRIPGASTRMSVEGELLKIETSSGGGARAGTDMVFRGGRRELVVIDHNQRSYTILDQDSFGQVSQRLAQRRQAMPDLEKQLSQLDPKQREMVERMMRGQMGGMRGVNPTATLPQPVMEFRRTGEQATQHGYPCVKYEVLRDGELVRELWVTDWSNIRGSAEARGVFKEMAAFMKEMANSFRQGIGSGPFASVAMSELEGFSEIEGFPVVTRSFEAGQLTRESALKSSSPQRLDPGIFEPPAAYNRQSLLP